MGKQRLRPGRPRAQSNLSRRSSRYLPPSSCASVWWPPSRLGVSRTTYTAPQPRPNLILDYTLGYGTGIIYPVVLCILAAAPSLPFDIRHGPQACASQSSGCLYVYAYDGMFPRTPTKSRSSTCGQREVKSVPRRHLPPKSVLWVLYVAMCSWHVGRKC